MFKFSDKMIRIIKKQFIFFFYFTVLSAIAGANNVAGLYNPPRFSVKFEKESALSILPVGWSKEGKTALLVEDHGDNTLRLIIVDTVVDSLLFDSQATEVKSGGIAGFWNTRLEEFSAKLAESGIIPEAKPLYGSGTFSQGNEKYTLNAEVRRLEGERGIAALSLTISSDRRGFKELYSYVYDGKNENILLDFTVLGYFRSPWENRIAVVSLADLGDSRVVSLNGAHLTSGYRREITGDTRLADAVLSGQFYMTEMALEKGADPRYTVPGAAPLVLLAASQGNWDIVFLLLEKGAEASVVDSSGSTLLHYAVMQDNRDSVIKLLKMGLNKNYRDGEGRTPLDLARTGGFTDLSDLLSD